MSDQQWPPSGTDLCASADVIDGKARVIGVPGTRGVEVIVVREGERVFGYLNECRHMAVALNLLDDFGVQTARYHLLCDHHSATFRFSDGYCVAGPCEGESLTAIALALRGERIVIE
jgi:nitrite reductase/ring-hydroxylating ferredoxin subunit